MAVERLAAGAVLLALLAAGCAAPAPARTDRPGPTPTTPPSPGVVRSVTFSVTVPSGWSDVTANSQLVAAVRPDGNLLLLLEGPQPTPVIAGANDVAAVIAVTEPRQPIASSDVAQYLRSVTANGGSDVTEPAPELVDHTQATGVSYQATFDGTPIQIKDVVVSHAGAMYEAELITSQVAFASEEPLFDRLLGSGWSWVSGD